MGAIYGFFGEVDQSEFSEMGARLLHRGKTIEEWSPDSLVKFGQIVDYGGSQVSKEGAVLLDGAVDNLEELSESDKVQRAGDTILDLFEQYGIKALGQLSGPFVLAIWDSRRRRLLLIRDRLGIRPLYITRLNTGWAFASEYKAFLAIRSFEAVPDREALLYLHSTRHTMPGFSCLQGVTAVPAGAATVLDQRSSSSLDRYWDLEIRPSNRSAKEQFNFTRSCVLDATARQVKVSADFGVALSGGFDSAVTLASLLRNSPDRKFHTFTAGYGDEDPEILGARELATFFGTTHHELVVSPAELPALLPEVVWHLEDPMGKAESVFLYKTARLAAAHVKGLFGGWGADGLYAGMPRHRLMYFHKHLAPLRTPLNDLFQYTQISVSPKTIVGKALVRGCFGKNLCGPPTILLARRVPQPDLLEQHCPQPINRYLRRHVLEGVGFMPLVDRMVSSAGLTFNSPFFDPRVVQAAFEVPEQLKITRQSQKYVLRQAFKNLLPVGICKRRKTLQRLKHNAELTAVVEQMSETLLDRKLVRERGIFEPSSVEKIVFRRHGSSYSLEQLHRIWTLILTELWCRIYLDDRGKKPPLTSTHLLSPQVGQHQRDGREHTEQPCDPDTGKNPGKPEMSQIFGR